MLGKEIMLHNDEILDPILEVDLMESQMQSYNGVSAARDEYRVLKNNDRKPVAFWVPKEQCRPPLQADRWEVLDELDSQHSGRIQQLRHAATKLEEVAI